MEHGIIEKKDCLSYPYLAIVWRLNVFIDNK